MKRLLQCLALCVVVAGLLALPVLAADDKPAADKEKPVDIKSPAVAAGSPDTIIVAVAGSKKADPKAAAIEATKAVLEACKGTAKGLIVYEDLATKAEVEAVVAGIKEAAGETPVIGVSAEALLTDQTIRGGVGVLAIGGKGVQVKTAVADLDKQRKNTAAALAKQLADLKNPKLIFVLSEPDLSFEPGVTVEEFLVGMKEAFGPDVPLFGGNCKPITVDKKETGIEFIDGKVYSRKVVAMAISGPFKCIGDHTTEFTPLGKPFTVTKADGKWIIELDGKPAAQVYREVRGMKATEPFTSDNQHPIGVLVTPERRYNRMILEWRDAAGNTGTGDKADKCKTGEETALRVITEIPEGSKVQVMGWPGTAEAIYASATASIKDMLGRANGAQPLLVMSSDCCARGGRLVEFSKGAGDEVKGGVADGIKGVAVPFFGFYAYGEIGPIRGPFKGLNYQYQQHTFVGLTLVAEQQTGGR